MESKVGSNSMEKIVTVFTPTYNRANTLNRLFSSLNAQTSHRFEWLIVDDSSTDNSEELINRIMIEYPEFPIRYYRKKNGGKHTAINVGVKKAKGYLFFIVDSDDYLTPEPISKILKWEETIENQEGYAGVAGNKGLSRNELIGKSFVAEYVDATSLERQRYSIEGDKAEVFYTSVLQKYPFPVYENEKFMTETVVWYKIAADNLKIRWYNSIIYIAEYLPDGLTANQIELYANNPQGFALSIKQKLQYFNYSKIQIDNEFYNYFQIVNKKVSLRKTASYLDITVFRLLQSIFLVYFRALLKKIKG